MSQERRGRAGDDTIERVREATDVVQLVGQYVNLKRSGRSFKGLCPFHTEKTPSFHVSPERQMYHCFGCHKGGDVFSFLMEHDGVSFGEALRTLAERAGIPVETRPERGGAHDALYETAERAAQFFEAQLVGPAGEPARRYLQQRGLKPEIVERFRLGAAPDAWESLGPGLRQEGVSQESLLGIGLVAARNRGGGWYDTFRNRLVIPIRSLSGRVVGFGGRILPGADSDQAPKYLNSPDSPIYHKGHLLYGMAEARGAIRRADAAILTEGYLDYLTLVQAGIEQVVAACGTAFTPQQAALLHRYTHRAYILGDSDPAGRRAAVRTAGLLLEHGFLIYVVELPSGYDPDSFVREHGGKALETRLREAPSYIAYMKLLVDRRAGDLTVKERVVRHLLDDLSRSTDPLMRELYRKELARSFAISEATLEAALDSRRGKPIPAAAGRGAAPAGEPAARPAVVEAERGLLRLALTSPMWVERLMEALGPGDFAPGPPRHLFEALCAVFAVPGQARSWLDALEGTEERSFATELALEEMAPGEPEALFHDYLVALKGARLEAEQRQLERDLAAAQAQGDWDQQHVLLARQKELAAERSALKKRTTWN